MSTDAPSPSRDSGIDGVRITTPKVFGDDRGSFYEGFRASWFSDRQRWVQWNVSRSSKGVVRGLHFHKLQTDYWLVISGKIQVGLVDLRSKSPTKGVAKSLVVEASDPQGIYIPPGVLHGYKSLEDATIMYLVDVEYTGKDEYGVKWNDPALKLPASWYDYPNPVLSNRDAGAPLLAECAARPE